MGKKKVLVSYGVDIDAVAGWLGSYGGEDSTSDISRGMQMRLYWGKCELRYLGLWAGTVGTQRLLKLFDKYKIKATWFIPGKPDYSYAFDQANIENQKVTPSKPSPRTVLPSATPAMRSDYMATRMKTR